MKSCRAWLKFANEHLNNSGLGEDAIRPQHGFITLRDRLLPLARTLKTGCGRVLQHVSDPKHVTKVTKERLKMEPVSRSQSCRKSGGRWSWANSSRDTWRIPVKRSGLRSVLRCVQTPWRLTTVLANKAFSTEHEVMFYLWIQYLFPSITAI